MELLVHIKWILLQFILIEKFSLCKANTPMCETCPPKHPQQHFCNSDFVIQGKILGRKDFITPLIKTTRITTPTAAVFAVSTSFPDKEGQVHVALPSKKQKSSVDALPWQPLREGSVFTALGSHFTDKMDDGGAGGRGGVPISEVVRYRVLVSKVYKGSKWVRNRDVVDIDYVRNEEHCGLTMRHLIKETLLISGTIMSGHLVHHSCDWSLISTKASFDVHRQLAHVFPRHCGICTIETKSSRLLGIQKVTAASSRCLYKPSFYTDKGVPDCEGLYGACKKIQHECSWSGNQRMRDCIRKRKTLFTSPSILESQTSPPKHYQRVQYPEIKSDLSLIKTSPERNSDLKPSVDPAENVSEKQEIPMMLLNDDKKDIESLQTSDEELSPKQEVHANKRKQDLTSTLSPSYRTDLPIMQSDPFRAVFSSHTAMPHHAFGLPRPHLSSQDAADILEKITQQHLQNKEV